VHAHVSTTTGDQTGHIRVWDLTAGACSCELVPEVGTAVRSLTVALDGSLIVAANNHGTCYVWRMMRGAMRVACMHAHECPDAAHECSYPDLSQTCKMGYSRLQAR
jgi:hypothetical protein